MYHAVRSIKPPFQNNFFHLVVTFFRSSLNQFLPLYFYFSSGKTTLIYYNLFNFLQKIFSAENTLSLFLLFHNLFLYTTIHYTTRTIAFLPKQFWILYNKTFINFKSNFFPHVVTLFHLWNYNSSWHNHLLSFLIFLKYDAKEFFHLSPKQKSYSLSEYNYNNSFIFLIQQQLPSHLNLLSPMIIIIILSSSFWESISYIFFFQNKQHNSLLFSNTIQHSTFFCFFQTKQWNSSISFKPIDFVSCP